MERIQKNVAREIRKKAGRAWVEKESNHSTILTSSAFLSEQHSLQWKSDQDQSKVTVLLKLSLEIWQTFGTTLHSDEHFPQFTITL
jgi:hypothetical protein